MTAIDIDYTSPVLNKSSQLVVTFPNDWDGSPLPTLYLLHGLSGDASTWMRRSAIERHVEQFHMMVAMPDTQRLWYTNNNGYENGRMEDHILHTIDYCDQLFPTVKTRSGRAIGGLSMGGYGATKIGLKHAHRFASVHSHSGAVDMRASPTGDEWADDYRSKQEFELVFGSELPPQDDPFALAAALSSAERPRLWLDCGTEDFLLAANRRFHQHLIDLGFEHDYHEFPGEHEWGYWDAHISKALAFHAAGFVAAGHGPSAPDTA